MVLIWKMVMGIGALILLSGCTVMKPKDFVNKGPKLILEEFFAGKTRGWGIFEDRFGNVKRQFVVDIDGAHVYVNGDMVNYPESITRRVHENWPIIVPESKYFVLGDNRELSFDSRNWGSVDEKLIIGKVWVVYWPFGKMKVF